MKNPLVVMNSTCQNLTVELMAESIFNCTKFDTNYNPSNYSILFKNIHQFKHQLIAWGPNVIGVDNFALLFSGNVESISSVFGMRVGFNNDLKLYEFGIAKGDVYLLKVVLQDGMNWDCFVDLSEIEKATK